MKLLALGSWGADRIWAVKRRLASWAVDGAIGANSLAFERLDLVQVR